jgi:hypothetical protein
VGDTCLKECPDVECDDCGKKVTMYQHWGPLVPPGTYANLCGECMMERSRSPEVKPLGHKKEAKNA